MKTFLTSLSALALASLSAFSASGPLRDKALALAEAHRDSVVFLNALVEIELTIGSGQSKTEERKIDILGTVIGKDGLIATSLSTIDVAANVDGRTVNGPQGPVTLSAKGTTKEVKILLSNGEEIAAKVVAKDPDLDLAFLRPEDPKAAASLVAIDAANHAPLQLLDDVIILGRLGKDLNREPLVLTSEMVAIIKKPRTFGKVNVPALGLPAFNSEGKFLGIGVNRFSAKDETNPQQGAASSVILPAEDLLESASQAE